MTEHTPPKHGWHPGHADPIKLKLWEVRHQLDINVEIIRRDHPQPKESVFPHIIETLTDHVYERLNELEKLIEAEKAKNVAEKTTSMSWDRLSGNEQVTLRTLGERRIKYIGEEPTLIAMRNMGLAENDAKEIWITDAGRALLSSSSGE